MKIVLTPNESEEFFYNALCNGLNFMLGYGIELDWDEKEYSKSREKLTDPCLEDVLMQMLKDGYKLIMVDHEGDGENTQSITLADVHERVQTTPFSHLADMIDENDDASTADVIIQTVFFNEVIFG